MVAETPSQCVESTPIGKKMREVSEEHVDKVVESAAKKAKTGLRDDGEIADQRFYAKMGKAYNADSKMERFQRMSDRKRESDMTPEIINALMLGQEHSIWRGVPFHKCACDVVAYQMLLAELRPKTIIDLGTWCGGSALWFAEMAEVLVGPSFSKVVSTDICLDNAHELTKNHPKIELHAIDSNKIDELFTEEFCRTLPRPWLVCEDCHFGFPKVMETFHKRMLPGDYFICEDTHPACLKWFDDMVDGKGASGRSSVMNVTAEEAELQHKEMALILAKSPIFQKYGLDYPDRYRVDSKYADMFGYNVGKAMNGIVKVMA